MKIIMRVLQKRKESQQCHDRDRSIERVAVNKLMLSILYIPRSFENEPVARNGSKSQLLVGITMPTSLSLRKRKIPIVIDRFNQHMM
jgi:hypothetical protein